MRNRVIIAFPGGEIFQVSADIAEVGFELAFLRGLAFLGVLHSLGLREERIAEIFNVLLVFQELGKLLGFFDRGGADEDRLAAACAVGDRRHDGGELFLLRAIDLVVLIDARDLEIGRDLDDVEAVDVHEL